MNLGQPSIKTLNALFVEIIQVIVTVERHQPSHLLQIAQQLTLCGQPVQKRNSTSHTSPTKNLQARFKRLLFILLVDRPLQPLAKLAEGALGLSPRV